MLNCDGSSSDAAVLELETSAELDTPVEIATAAEIEPSAPAVAEPASDSTTEVARLNQAPASLTKNDLIAKTFAALDLGFVTTPGELTARSVRTVAIGPDGAPVQQASETAPEEAGPVEAVASAEPAPVAVAEADAPVVEDEPSQEAATASAYASVRGGVATVGRQGANVRSQPQTRGSDVLYSLASGAEVSIVEKQKGWSKVVDERGRSGWIWDELLQR